MACDYPQDPYGCVQFRHWEKSLEEGCKYPCFVLGSAEPGRKVSKPQKREEASKIEELPIEPLTAPLTVQPVLSTGEVQKPPISQSNVLLAPLLIAAVTSVSIPLVKDWVKSKWSKRDEDGPIECKPAQVKTNRALAELSSRIERLENNFSINSPDNLEEIKGRLEKLEEAEKKNTGLFL